MTQTKEPILCYVRGAWAYFTTQELSRQWGDDWNDAPYEHNAGDPNEYHDYHKSKGIEPWRIVKVAWDGPFEAPCDFYPNSYWSVEQINGGAIPWLRTPTWAGCRHIEIPAGTTLSDFCKLIRDGGGAVYTTNNQPN